MIQLPKATIFPALLLLGAHSLVEPQGAGGAAFVWAGTTGNWSDSAKWVGGTAPTGTDAADILTFGGTTYVSTNNFGPVPTSLNQLVLNSTGAPIIGGNRLLFAGLDPGIFQQNVGTFQLNTPVQAARTLTLGGNSGVVSLGFGLSGHFNVTKQGSSEFSLQPAQSPPAGSHQRWTGSITIDGGKITSGGVALRGNPVSLTSATSVVTAASNIGELRLGTLSGASGLVESHPVGNEDSEDLVIHAYSDGTFGGTVRVAPAGAAGKDRGALIVRGTGRQTLTGAVVSPGSPPGSGALQISKDVAVGRGATLTLTGNASLGKQAEGAVILSGGTFELDNRALNNNDRVRDADTGSTGVDSYGGGVFKLIGNAAGTTEVAGRLQLGSATNQRSGAVTVAVQHNAGSTAATELILQSLSRDGSAPTFATVDFRATDGNGAALPLGQSGFAPRIMFGNPPPLTNGLLRNTRNLNSIVGWATVNGSAFAAHGPNGVAAVALTTPPAPDSSGDATANVEIRGSFSVDAATTSAYRLSTLRLEPSAAGQTLTIPTRGVSTQGLLLAGERDYTITGPIQAPFIYVDQATLIINGNNVQSGFTKSGEGILALDQNPQPLTPIQPFFTINAGIVRASTVLGRNAHFRGGVLELTGGGTFSASVSPGGGLNWQGQDEFLDSIAEDVGSGGFAAFGADVSIVLTPSLLEWEDSGFVQSGHALIFGSRTADRRVTWTNSLSLTESDPSGNYNAREIRVNDNSASTGDFAQLSGVISGQFQNDLLKTGSGTLELTAANSYIGATLVREGRLLVDGAVATTGSSFLIDVYSGAIFGGNGIAGAVKVRSGGTIAPGSLSTSVANFRTGALTLDAGASLALEIGGLAEGPRNDQLVVTGPVDLGGSNVVLSLTNGFQPQQNDIFVVLSNDGTDPIIGTFAQGLGVTVDDVMFEISYAANAETGSFTGGNDIALRVVPEPVAALALLAAVPLLLGRADRRRSRI